MCKIAKNNLDNSLCADDVSKNFLVSMLQSALVIAQNRLIIKRLELEIEEIKRGRVL